MFKGASKKIYIWLYTFKLSINSQRQYRKNFYLRCFVVFITYLCEFISTWFLITKIQTIGIWTSVDILLIYGLATTSYSLSRCFFSGFNGVSGQIKNGSFFMNMIRPFDEKFMLISQGIPLDRIGQFFLGAIIILYACMKHSWSISLLGLIFYIIVGTMIYGSLFIISSAISFWIVDSKELMGILTHGTLRAIVYPLTIYNKIIKHLLTYIIPVAFVSYYPSLILLRKIDDLKIIFLIPIVGVWTFSLSLYIWKLGIRKYEGSGG